MAVKANFVIDQGSDFSANVDLTDSVGAAYDLTNYTVAAQMRKSYASSNAVTFICSHDNANGHISMTLPNSNTAVLVPGRYLYDIEITDSQNTVTRVVEGLITVTPGMTRI